MMTLKGFRAIPRRILYWIGKARELFLKIVIVFTTFAALIAMAALILVSLFRIGNGIWFLWNATNHEAELTGLGAIFHGLDLLLLAPVAYMASLGIGSYLLQFDVPDSRTGLVSTKSFIVGLLAAALAVRLVERLLGESPATGSEVVAYCLAIAVLAAYSLLSEAIVSVVHRPRP
jgi:hypothetical protein